MRNGVLRREPYIGTYLTPQSIPLPLSPAFRLKDAIETAGMRHESRLVSQRLITPSSDVARILAIPARSQVVEISKLVSANNSPLCLVTIWLPADRLGRIATLIASIPSLRRALAQLGISETHCKHVRISGRHTSLDERRLLETNPQSVVLIMEGVSTDATGEPTHAYTYVMDARRASMVIDL